MNINHDQRLYVIPCGDGYSCLGFDVAEKRRLALVKWLRQSAHDNAMRDWLENAAQPMEVGTAAHWQAYGAAISAAAVHSGKAKQPCPVELEPRLIGLEGKRVEVTERDGSKRRFTVGKSTGWLPCHLELARRGARGGSAVYLPEGAIVRPV